jgi:hypothetical protein
MKMKTISIVSIMLAMALWGCSVTSSTTGQGAAGLDNMESLIKSGNYEFTIRSASPSGGRTIQITTAYSMKAVDGKYQAYLPYFGRAYSAGYGEDGGIEFNGDPENLEITRNDKKKTVSAAFTIRSEKDQFKVSLVVSASGYGNMFISSDKRQSISYYGITGELKH